MADDNDRWLHRVPGSRELAWVVRSLGADVYDDLLAIDGRVTYSERMTAARARVEAEIARSFAVASASRSERRVGDVTVVSAMCDGHPSEIADAWGKQATNTVFALWDAKSLAVSFRRSPDCRVDLSHLAAALGGGGHARPRAQRCPSSAACSSTRSRRGSRRRSDEARPDAHRARRRRTSTGRSRSIGSTSGLRVVHERNDGGMRVVWLGEDEPEVDFVLVLLPIGAPSGARGNLLHLGFAVGSREEVDAAAAAARADGILAVEPVYGWADRRLLLHRRRPGREPGRVLVRAADQSSGLASDRETGRSVEDPGR
jgi:hypothetical protein